MNDEQDKSLNVMLDDYERKVFDLESNKQKLDKKAEEYKNNLRAKKHQKLSSFDQDIIQRYSPLQNWDLVFSSDHPSVLYISKKIDKTDQLVTAVGKQISAKEKIYMTKEEVKQLFVDLGIIYLDRLKIDTSITGDINGFYTPFYDKNKKILDTNRKFLSFVINQYRGPISVKWVNEKVGFGVFAIADIRSGDFIQEYTGVLQKAITNRGDFDSSYSWNYPVVGNYAENELLVDSKFEGNEMRFVNHSNHPNAQEFKIIDNDGVYHVCYIAIKDILTGEQIIVSYGINYWAARDFFEEL